MKKKTQESTGNDVNPQVNAQSINVSCYLICKAFIFWLLILFSFSFSTLPHYYVDNIYSDEPLPSFSNQCLNIKVLARLRKKLYKNG